MNNVIRLPIIDFRPVRRDCGYNNELAPGKQAIIDYVVVVNGEDRALFDRISYTGMGYDFSHLNDRAKILFDPQNHYSYRQAKVKAGFMRIVKEAMEVGVLPTCEQVEQRKTMLADAHEAKIAEAVAELNKHYRDMHSLAMQDALRLIASGAPGDRRPSQIAADVLCMIKQIERLPPEHHLMNTRP